MEVFYRYGLGWQNSDGFADAAPEWLKQGFLMGNITATSDGTFYNPGDKAFDSGGYYYSIRTHVQAALEGGLLYYVPWAGFPTCTREPIVSLGNIVWSRLDQIVPYASAYSNPIAVTRNGVPQSEGYFGLIGPSTDIINTTIKGDSFIPAGTNILSEGEWVDSSVGFNSFLITEHDDKISYLANNTVDATMTFKSVEGSCFVTYFSTAEPNLFLNLEAPLLEVYNSKMMVRTFKAVEAFEITNSCFLCHYLEVGSGYIRNSDVSFGGMWWEPSKVSGKLEMEKSSGMYYLPADANHGTHGFKTLNTHFSTPFRRALKVVCLIHPGHKYPSKIFWDLEIINDLAHTIEHINGEVTFLFDYYASNLTHPATSLYFRIIIKNCRFAQSTGPSMITIALPPMTTNTTADKPHEILIENVDAVDFQEGIPQWHYKWSGTINANDTAITDLEKYGIPTNRITKDSTAASAALYEVPLADKLEGEHEYKKLFGATTSGSSTPNKALKYYLSEESGDNPPCTEL